MRCSYLLFLIATMVLLSCKKENAAPIPPPSDPPTQPAPAVLLKDITIPNLPSPFYHFEYNTAGRVSFVSFASDFNRYDVTYNGDRINEMRNNIIVNKDRLQYFYDNEGRVSSVNVTDSMGLVYKKIYLSYNGQQLIKLEREQKSNPGFITEKTMTMLYHNDGNLFEIRDYRPPNPLNGQPEFTYIDRFEQYDNKINTDGFILFHNEFFEHLVLLPGIKLQKNNPGRLTRTGDGVNYQIDYTYTYNNMNAPLTKNGDGLWLNGATAGQRFQTHNVFTYY